MIPRQSILNKANIKKTFSGYGKIKIMPDGSLG